MVVIRCRKMSCHFHNGNGCVWTKFSYDSIMPLFLGAHWKSNRTETIHDCDRQNHSGNCSSTRANLSFVMPTIKIQHEYCMLGMHLVAKIGSQLVSFARTATTYIASEKRQTKAQDLSCCCWRRRGFPFGIADLVDKAREYNATAHHNSTRTAATPNIGCSSNWPDFLDGFIVCWKARDVPWSAVTTKHKLSSRDIK